MLPSFHTNNLIYSTQIWPTNSSSNNNNNNETASTPLLPPLSTLLATLPAYPSSDQINHTTLPPVLPPISTLLTSPSSNPIPIQRSQIPPSSSLGASFFHSNHTVSEFKRQTPLPCNFLDTLKRSSEIIDLTSSLDDRDSPLPSLNKKQKTLDSTPSLNVTHASVIVSEISDPQSVQQDSAILNECDTLLAELETKLSQSRSYDPASVVNLILKIKDPQMLQHYLNILFRVLTKYTKFEDALRVTLKMQSAEASKSRVMIFRILFNADSKSVTNRLNTTSSMNRCLTPFKSEVVYSSFLKEIFDMMVGNKNFQKAFEFSLEMPTPLKTLSYNSIFQKFPLEVSRVLLDKENTFLHRHFINHLSIEECSHTLDQRSFLWTSLLQLKMQVPLEQEHLKSKILDFACVLFEVNRVSFETFTVQIIPPSETSGPQKAEFYNKIFSLLQTKQKYSCAFNAAQIFFSESVAKHLQDEMLNVIEANPHLLPDSEILPMLEVFYRFEKMKLLALGKILNFLSNSDNPSLFEAKKSISRNFFIEIESNKKYTLPCITVLENAPRQTRTQKMLINEIVVMFAPHVKMINKSFNKTTRLCGLISKDVPNGEECYTNFFKNLS